LVTACTSSGGFTPETTYDGPPVSLDVLASSGGIRISARGDLGDPPACTYLDEFPQPGACSVSTDVSGCNRIVTSCLTRVAFGGRVFDVSEHLIDDIVVAHDGGGELDIDGCGGHWSVTIPPGPYSAPMPMVSYTETGAQYLVSANWAPVDGAATYLVGIGYGFGGQSCHVTDTQHVFDAQTMVRDNMAGVTVQAFRPVVTDEEPTGTLRLWIGDGAHVEVRAPNVP
jgi:hypothetical protein